MKYFAYGSNMLTKQLVDRVGMIKDLGRAALKSYILDFSKLSEDGSGKANIKNGKKNSETEGALFELNPSQFDELDRYEVGYSQYPVTVSADSNKIFKATTYIAKDETVRNGLRPTKEYLCYIVKGAKEERHRLSDSYILFLESHKFL